MYLTLRAFYFVLVKQSLLAAMPVERQISWDLRYSDIANSVYNRASKSWLLYERWSVSAYERSVVHKVFRSS